MTALALSRRRLLVEATAAGAWLGLTQVALGFALMAGAGASALLFFSLTAAWLAGSALGLTLAPRGSSAWLLGAALALAVVARVVLQLVPFMPSAVVLGLLAGASAGSFAGAFIRDRAGASGDVRAVLLYENNGFIAGYLVAGSLLMLSTRALDVAAGALGLGLWAYQAVTPQGADRELDEPALTS